MSAKMAANGIRTHARTNQIFCLVKTDKRIIIKKLYLNVQTNAY